MRSYPTRCGMSRKGLLLPKAKSILSTKNDFPVSDAPQTIVALLEKSTDAAVRVGPINEIRLIEMHSVKIMPPVLAEFQTLHSNFSQGRLFEHLAQLRKVRRTRPWPSWLEPSTASS